MKQKISKFNYDAMTQRWKEIIEMNFATQENADRFMANFEAEDEQDDREV